MEVLFYMFGIGQSEFKVLRLMGNYYIEIKQRYNRQSKYVALITRPRRF